MRIYFCCFVSLFVFLSVQFSAPPNCSLASDFIPHVDSIRKDYDGKYAIVIGVDDYKYESDLKFAVNDAREIAKVLTEDFGFTVFQTEMPSPTREDIEALFKTLTDQIAEIPHPERGCLIFFFAGHSLRIGDSGFLLASDSKREGNKYKNAISNELLVQLMADCKCEHKLAILDSCYSGSLFQDAPLVGISEVRSRDFISSYLHQPVFWGLFAGRNTPVWDGSRELGYHSIFTASLINVLRDRADSTRDDQSFTFRELAARVETAVQSNPKSCQVPDYRRLNSGNGDIVFRPTNLRPTRSLINSRVAYHSVLRSASGQIADKQYTEARRLIHSLEPQPVDKIDRRDWLWHYLLDKTQPEKKHILGYGSPVMTIDWPKDVRQLNVVYADGNNLSFGLDGKARAKQSNFFETKIEKRAVRGIMRFPWGQTELPLTNGTVTSFWNQVTKSEDTVAINKQEGLELRDIATGELIEKWPSTPTEKKIVRVLRISDDGKAVVALHHLTDRGNEIESNWLQKNAKYQVSLFRLGQDKPYPLVTESNFQCRCVAINNDGSRVVIVDEHETNLFDILARRNSFKVRKRAIKSKDGAKVELNLAEFLDDGDQLIGSYFQYRMIFGKHNKQLISTWEIPRLRKITLADIWKRLTTGPTSKYVPISVTLLEQSSKRSDFATSISQGKFPNQMIAIGTLGGSVKLIVDGEISEILRYTNPITAIRFSSSFKSTRGFNYWGENFLETSTAIYLAIGDSSGSIYVLERWPNEVRLRQASRAKRHYPQDFAVSKDKKLLSFTNSNKEMRIFDLNSLGPSKSILRMAYFSANQPDAGVELPIGSDDKKDGPSFNEDDSLLKIPRSSRFFENQTEFEVSNVCNPVFSPDSKFIAVKARRQNVNASHVKFDEVFVFERILDTNQIVKKTSIVFKSAILDYRFSQDGNTLLVHRLDGTFEAVDLRDGRRSTLFRSKIHLDGFNSRGFEHIEIPHLLNSNFLVLSGPTFKQSELTITEATSGSSMKFGQISATINHRPSPMVFSISGYPALEVWDLNAKSLIGAIPGEFAPLAISPDSRFIAVLSQSENELLIINAQNLEVISRSAAANKVVFTPDSKFFLAVRATDSINTFEISCQSIGGEKFGTTKYSFPSELNWTIGNSEFWSDFNRSYVRFDKSGKTLIIGNKDRFACLDVPTLMKSIEINVPGQWVAANESSQFNLDLHGNLTVNRLKKPKRIEDAILELFDTIEPSGLEYAIQVASNAKSFTEDIKVAIRKLALNSDRRLKLVVCENSVLLELMGVSVIEELVNSGDIEIQKLAISKIAELATSDFDGKGKKLRELMSVLIDLRSKEFATPELKEVMSMLSSNGCISQLVRFLSEHTDNKDWEQEFLDGSMWIWNPNIGSFFERKETYIEENEVPSLNKDLHVLLGQTQSPFTVLALIDAILFISNNPVQDLENLLESGFSQAAPFWATVKAENLEFIDLKPTKLNLTNDLSSGFMFWLMLDKLSQNEASGQMSPETLGMSESDFLLEMKLWLVVEGSFFLNAIDLDDLAKAAKAKVNRPLVPLLEFAQEFGTANEIGKIDLIVEFFSDSELSDTIASDDGVLFETALLIASSLEDKHTRRILVALNASKANFAPDSEYSQLLSETIEILNSKSERKREIDRRP